MDGGFLRRGALPLHLLCTSSVPPHLHHGHALRTQVHMLKNPKGKSNLAAFEVLELAGCQPRFGLTGTPMSNKYEELWSMFDFVSNQRVGTKRDFIKYYANKLKAGFKLQASQWEINERMRRQKQVKALMDEWMLQRFKTLIQDQMPNKEDNIVFCKLASEQQA